MLRSALFCVLLLNIAAIVSLTMACSSTYEQRKPEWTEASRPVLPASAPSKRIALVIGNSAYPSGPLSSPKDDANAVDGKLNALDFLVTTKTDLRREEFFDAIREFGDRLQQYDTVGLFYYSGHGMQVNNRNYMIPTDADIRSEVDVERYAVPVEDVLARMELGKSNPSIVILDACRNNPFEKRFKSSQDGLASMDAPAGTLIAFAAAPRRVTQAGFGGKLSLYTEVLTEHIDRPYSNFTEMFRTVQDAVYERSKGKQSPRVETSPGLRNFSFKQMVVALPSPAPVSPSENTGVNHYDAAPNEGNRLRITHLAAVPARVYKGENTTITARYSVIDANLQGAIAIKETWSFSPGVRRPEEISKLVMVRPGTRQAEFKVQIPRDAPAGVYDIAFRVNAMNGPSDEKRTPLTVRDMVQEGLDELFSKGVRIEP